MQLSGSGGCGAPQAVPDGWLRCADQDGAREAGTYLTKARGIIAFSSLNIHFSPWKVKIQCRGNDCPDLLDLCSVQKKDACVMICLGSIFRRFLISNRLPGFRFLCAVLKIQMVSINIMVVYQTIYPAALGFSVSFSSVWEDQVVPPRTEIIFPLSSQAFFFLIWQMSADGAKCEKTHPLPCQRWSFFANRRMYPGYPVTVVWITCGCVRGDDHSICGQTILPSRFCRYHRGARCHLLFEYCFKMGRVD